MCWGARVVERQEDLADVGVQWRVERESGALSKWEFPTDIDCINVCTKLIFLAEGQQLIIETRTWKNRKNRKMGEVTVFSSHQIAKRNHFHPHRFRIAQRMSRTTRAVVSPHTIT